MPDTEDELVSDLGRMIGFGNMMSRASRIWGKILYPPGGEFVVGPCRAMTVKCGCRSHEAGRAALLDPNGHCDWCCGCGWVTKTVRARQRAVMREAAANAWSSTTSTRLVGASRSSRSAREEWTVGDLKLKLVRCTSRGWSGKAHKPKRHWGITNLDGFLPELCTRVGKTAEEVLRADIASRREAIREQQKAIRQLQTILDGLQDGDR